MYYNNIQLLSAYNIYNFRRTSDILLVINVKGF
jgi:hypothetical protein